MIFKHDLILVLLYILCGLTILIHRIIKFLVTL